MSLPFLFPKNLLPCKIFLGALIILGVLGAYFTRPSPPKKYPHQNGGDIFYMMQEVYKDLFVKHNGYYSYLPTFFSKALTMHVG
jgi:hypothetical protein